MTDAVFGVDGNWYLHRVVHSQFWESKDEQLSQAARFLGMICKDAAAVKAKRIFVAFDGNKIFRYKVYKGYKANREDSGESKVYEHLAFVIDYLRKKAGIPVVHDARYEADDWMASLGTQWEGPVFIGCRDKDAYQYVKKGIVLYDSGAKPEPRKIDSAWIKNEFGITGKQFLDYQTLIGDQIDCVPRLMKESEAIKGLKKYGSIKEWAEGSPRMMKWCRTHQAELLRNRKLVRLVRDLQIDVPPIKWNTEDKMTKSYYALQNLQSVKTKSLF